MSAPKPKNNLFRSLFALRGNQRACVYTEPLWGIPYNLYSPYATLFMVALGVTDQQIGFLLSIGAIFQVISALLGGILCDKLGRRKTTAIFDILSWSVPCLIWMFSQNFWWFFAAAVVNGMWKITDNAWNCLLVEDAPEDDLVDIYTWINVSGLLAVFFAPISAILINKLTLVPTMRILYFVTFVMMTSKFLILYFASRETKQGRIRMEETKNISMGKMLWEYKDVFLQVIKSAQTRFIIIIYALINVSAMVTGSFFSLYITENLNISQEFVSIFPMIRAAFMLVFIFTVQNFFNKLRYRPIMVASLILYIASHAALLVAPTGNLLLVLGYTLFEAFACALFSPRRDALMVIFIDAQERSRIQSLLYVVTMAITTPFGWLIGQLSAMDRRLPFILNIIIFAVIALLVLGSKELKKQDQVSE